MNNNGNNHVFSPLDYVIPPLNGGLIYAFPCRFSSRGQIHSILQQGLDQLVHDKTLLAAEVLRVTDPDVRPGSMQLHLPDPRIVQITRLDLDQPGSKWPVGLTYAKLKALGMPPSTLDASTLAPAAGGSISTKKLMTVQLNFVDGGCLLSVTIPHSVFDAWGVNLIMQAWAEKCRCLQGDSKPNDERQFPGLTFGNSGTALSFAGEWGSTSAFARLKSRPELWHALCLHEADNLVPPKIPRDLVVPTTIPAAAGTSGHGTGLHTCIFALSPNSLAWLRSAATPNAPGTVVSNTDALVALLWRHILRARFPPGQSDTPSDQPSTISAAIDGRRSALRPAVPTSYCGNCVFFALTSRPLSVLVDSRSSPLHELAAQLHNAVTSVREDGQLLADAVELAAAMPDVRAPSIAMKDYLGLDFSVVHWTDNPFGSARFGPVLDGGRHEGDGAPEFFRMPKGQFGGICGLLPRRPDGTVEVMISLKPGQMERLLADEEFTQWTTLLCGEEKYRTARL